MAKHFAPAKGFPNNRKAAVITVVLALTVAILLISGIGRAISDNILMPIFGSAPPAVTPMPDDRTNGRINLPRLDVYLLQLGSYAEAAPASAEAKAIAQRGGAGYVLNQGSYRVIAAGYLTQAEAQSVADKQTDKEFSPSVFMLSSGSVSFKLQCSKEQLDILRRACEYYPSLVKDLMEESVLLDSCEATASRVRINYTYRLTAVEEIIAGLESLPYSPDEELIPRLLTVYRNARLQLNNISLKTSKEGLDFFSEIKYNYIEMIIAYRDMIKNLS